MVMLVVVINLTITLILLYVAYRVWLIRPRLARLADTLAAIERSTGAVLRSSPNLIYTGQQGIRGLRQGNKPLQLQLQQVKQVLSLFLLGQQSWRRFSRPLPKRYQR